MNTPFAQLEKQAATSYARQPWSPNHAALPPMGYKYRTGASGLNDPYKPATSTVKPRSGWWDAAEMGMDTVAGLSSLVPGVGGIVNGVWQGGKSLYHLATGQKGKAAEDALWAAAGFIPGGGLGAAGKGATMLAKVPGLLRAGQAVSAGRGALAATRLGGAALQGGRVIANSGVGRIGANIIANHPGKLGIGTTAAGMAAGSGIIPGFGNKEAPPAELPAAAQDGGSLTDAMAQTLVDGAPNPYLR